MQTDSTFEAPLRLRDLFTLRLFAKVPETGTLSEAAPQANPAVGAASRRIALRKERLGVRLFVRTPGGFVLPPAGVALLDSAWDCLERARSIESEMADPAGGIRGTIRIQTNPSAIIPFLPADLAAFAAARPDVRLDQAGNMTVDIVNAVGVGKADPGIVIGGRHAD